MSDWVADVCSSDLLIVGSLAGALPPAKSMLYRLFSRHDIAPRPQDARLGRFSDLLANEDDGAPAAVDPEQDVALIQYTGGTTGLPKGAMLTHQNLTARSEEHTSELQSLMRISYAVFCLKKKKKHQNTHKTITINTNHDQKT